MLTTMQCWLTTGAVSVSQKHFCFSPSPATLCRIRITPKRLSGLGTFCFEIQLMKFNRTGFVSYISSGVLQPHRSCFSLSSAYDRLINWICEEWAEGRPRSSPPEAEVAFLSSLAWRQTAACWRGMIGASLAVAYLHIPIAFSGHGSFQAGDKQ